MNDGVDGHGILTVDLHSRFLAFALFRTFRLHLKSWAF